MEYFIIAMGIIFIIVIIGVHNASLNNYNINKKSIEKLKSNIDENNKVITEAINAKDNVTNAKINNLVDDIKFASDNAERMEREFNIKIQTVKTDTDYSLRSLQKDIENKTDEVYSKTIKYSDTQFSDLKSYINNLKGIVDVLNNENELLKFEIGNLNEELKEQKKILDYYINIDKNAESIVETVDLSDSIEHKNPDDEQKYAYEQINMSKNNYFITGKAGTGKSFLLNYFMKNTSKTCVVLAPTGIAALNVNGATIHSLFGYDNLANLDYKEINKDTIKLNSNKRDILKKVDTIVIDEISMVRVDVFEKIDRILKLLNDSKEPFGGKQMLVFGDLFQLPPVAEKNVAEYLINEFGGIFFFDSKAYKKGDFNFIELMENHRQIGDNTYFEILNRIRSGEANNEDINILNSRYTPEEDVYDRLTALLPKKDDTERVNNEQLNQLKSKDYFFEAKVLLDEKKKITDSFIAKTFPVYSKLRLRKGALVMMVANDIEKRWVNGSVGIIKEISKEKIIVSFGAGKNYDIDPVEFNEQEAEYVNGKIRYKKISSIKQYPIVPSYAITIHKSQGQTYKNVMCDVDGCFANGQAYVALSRCSSLEGLHLKNKITLASIKVDDKVVEFYKKQKNLIKA